MAENDSLDSFLASNTPDHVNSGSSSPSTATPRPKLKKIKRAKVRPAADIPTAPEKIIPEMQEPIQPKGEDDLSETLESAVEEAHPEETTAPATSLVTAADAHSISENNPQNPYVLDSLPPELDYVTDENVEDYYLATSDYVKKSVMYITAGVCLFVGLFIGKAFFAEQKIENYGLEGVVANSEVPSGRPRCGLTDKSQACVFYMLNWYKQELNGRDFYKLAAQLTGREEYMIETENLHYANVKIKPGHFAQLNIPALK